MPVSEVCLFCNKSAMGHKDKALSMKFASWFCSPEHYEAYRKKLDSTWNDTPIVMGKDDNE